MLDLDEVNVMLENAEVFGSVLSGVGGSTGGGRQSSQSPSVAPATPKDPPPFIASLLLFMFTDKGAAKYKPC